MKHDAGVWSRAEACCTHATAGVDGFPIFQPPSLRGKMQPRPQSAVWLFVRHVRKSRAPRCWRTFPAPRCSSTQRMDVMQRGEDSITISPGLMTPSSGVFTATSDGADVSHVTAKETHYSPMSCCIVVAMSFLTFVEFGLVMPVSEVPVAGVTLARAARLAGFAPFRCQPG